MGRQAPDGLLGVHFNFLDAIPKELLTGRARRLGSRSPTRNAISSARSSGSSCAATSPRWASTRRRSATRSSIRRSASPPGCSTTTPTATRRSRRRSSRASRSGGLTRDNVLDNITLYWVTGTGASTSRLYWETSKGAAASFKNPPPHIEAAGRVHGLPGRALPGAAPLGEACVPQPHLLQRGSPRAGTSPPGRSPRSSRDEMRAAFTSLRDGRSHEHERRGRDRDPAVPRRVSGGGDRRPAPARRRDAAGRARSSSPTARRACSWRRCRRSPATGWTGTTGGAARRSSTRCRSS